MSKNTSQTRVLALTKYGRRAASSRHRFFDYIPLLEERGFMVTPAPLLSDAYVEGLYSGKGRDLTDIARSFLQRVTTLSTAHRFDLLWIEGELFPRFPALIERVLALLRCPYVIDLDDAIFHTYDLHPQPLVRRFLGRKIDVVLARATAVNVGNDYLADRALRAGAQHVSVIPTTVDPDAYPPPLHVPEQLTTLGWIGSPATTHYLRTIKDELEELHRTLPARLCLIGIAQSASPLTCGDCKPWSETTHGAELARCDLGLAPLFDGPWERGKCALKAIQYMAAGLPVLAADVGTLPHVVVHGETGFIYRNGDEFLAFARQLASDRDLRIRMGSAGRQRVANKYAIQGWADTVANILSSAAAQARA